MSEQDDAPEFICEVCTEDASSGGQCDYCGVNYCAEHIAPSAHDCGAAPEDDADDH